MSKPPIETDLEISVRLVRDGENIDPKNFVNWTRHVTFDSRNDADRFAKKLDEFIFGEEAKR